LILILAANTRLQAFRAWRRCWRAIDICLGSSPTSAIVWCSQMELSCSQVSQAVGMGVSWRHQPPDSALRGRSFLSFTLSQAGMIVHWRREGKQLRAMRAAAGTRTASAEQIGKKQSAEMRLTGKLEGTRLAKPGTEPKTLAEVIQLEKKSHWRKSLVINAVGAVATGIVLFVFIATKFIHGAWVVVFLIPLLVLLFLRIHRHYIEVAKQLSTEGLSQLRPIHHEVIVPISGIHRGVIEALEYAKSIAPHHVTAVYVNLDDEAAQKLREKWQQWGSGVNLVVVASPYRSLARPLLNYMDRVKRTKQGVVITVVLPEFVPAKWWQNLLHNQNTLFLKGALLFKKGIVVTNVPYHLEH
jgi:hypothetical protein